MKSIHEFNVDDRYECFVPVMKAMIDQIQAGKGMAQHGTDEDFHDQDTWKYVQICTFRGPLFQMLKKATESVRMFERGEHEKAHAEMIGALNYGMMAAMYMEGVE